MRVVRFFISSRLLVSSLALCVVGPAGISCQKKTEVAEPIRTEKPPERDLNWTEQPLGGVAAMPAQPVLVKQGSLPLAYLSEQTQTVQIHDLTDNEVLAEMPIGGRSIIHIDERGGIAIGKELFYPGPLDAKHKYGVYVIPDSENVSRTGSYQPRPPRDARPAELGSVIMQRLLSKLRLPLLASAFAVAGCSSGPKVPENAQLLWFGSSSVNVNVDDLPAGTFYIVDDGNGKTVSAVYFTGGKQPVSWSGLKAGRKYRLYFVPGPIVNAAEPAV